MSDYRGPAVLGAPQADGHQADSPPSQSSVGGRSQSQLRPGRGWGEGRTKGRVWEGIWAHLEHNLGEGLLQFAVHSGQLLVVAVGFQDGDQGLVYLIHCLVEPALGVGVEQVRISSTLPGPLQPGTAFPCFYSPSKALSTITSSR